jgi:hypothetical protein
LIFSDDISVSTSAPGPLFRLDVQIKIRHPDQLLDVRPVDQGAAEQHDLLIDVRLCDQTGHQRPENRLGIDKDARRRFVLVGNGQDGRHACRAHDPGDDDPQPATLPHPAQDR